MTTTIAIDVVAATIAAEEAAELPIEQLEVAIWRGAANLTAAEHDWLRAVAEFDRRRGWERWEAHSCAHWLSWQVGLDVRAAREKVRVAHALDRFGQIAAAMAEGTLSYSKVRAITRVATAATEVALLEMALAGTTNQVERMVSAMRRGGSSDAATDDTQWAARGMWHRVEPDGSVVVTLRLPPEQGTAFLSACEQYAPPADVGEDGTLEPRAARRADGAVNAAFAAHAALAHTLSAPAYLVTLHADVAALQSVDAADAPQGVGTSHEGHAPQGAPFGDGEYGCEIEGHGDAVELPIGVSPATASRLSCDADVETLVLMASVSGLTGRSSVVTGRLRRLVLARDRCCQFPNCGRRAGVQVHHLHERRRKGKNHPDNLTVLCHFHHRRVHEGGWQLQRDAHGGLVFTSPAGQQLTQTPTVVPGHAADVAAKGRTPEHGRSQWMGDRLDIGLALEALASHERVSTGWQPRTP